MDPWTEQGQITVGEVTAEVHEIRMHAERAIELVEQARTEATLRELDTLDALELGARRIDFLAFKFQAAQQIADAYRLAIASNDGKRSVGSPLFHIDYLYED